MIPIRDINPRHRFPAITIALIVINVAVFLYEWSLPEAQLVQLFNQWGFVPARGATGALTIVTSMFLHGGWLHLGSNMLYLWIFGDNIEDRLGHGRFLVFYLLCGAIAAAAQYAVAPGSTIPMVGASGAIAGVLGGYLLSYPLARVQTLVPLIVVYFAVKLPAIVVLAFWFVLQLFNGVASISDGRISADLGGVAFFAHIGGFVAGLLLIRLFGMADDYHRKW
jgi:membrane associated rhomboid family serine protease